jgi:hypothetical protein
LTIDTSQRIGIGTDTPNEKLTITGNVSATQTVFASGGNSNVWNQAYNIATMYSAASGTFATNTLLQSTSALLTPLALTNTLTGQLVLNADFNSYKTTVAAATATLLPTTTYQQASGNWQSTYTIFSQNSGNYCTKSLALAFAIAL